MRISDWSSDVCSSDLSLRQRLLLGRIAPLHDIIVLHAVDARPVPPVCGGKLADIAGPALAERRGHQLDDDAPRLALRIGCEVHHQQIGRSEEHTPELQSLMRISYAVFCLKTKN